ncbi:MAG TPA: MBL fold metallo-hydrolase, partial [Thermoplasmatales archaeon]|nr:MBL fold metallo-hydrolase [Thermoplasmatales archaeon]
MDTIKFLGTAGARFTVTQQVRRSGGLWLDLEDVKILFDPGPGSLVRCLSSKPKLDPRHLDAIILSHRHIDHSNDVNIMIEAMTNGGNKKRGILFAPSDALDEDPVVLYHFREHLERIERLRKSGEYKIRDLSFKTPVKHIHSVETYGFNFYTRENVISIITDTKYFDGLEKFYPGNILILNVVLLKSKDHILHLSLEDAERIIENNQPEVAVLTHFGMTMIKAKPWKLAEDLSKKIGVKVV